jgi:hypothetical protein
MSELSTATAVLTLAATEMKEAKESFEAIRQDSDKRVSGSLNDLEAWKLTAFESDEADNNVWRGSQNKIDLLHLSPNLMYPVVFMGSSSRVNHYEVSRGYSGDRLEGESLAGLFFKCSWVGDTWGGNPLSLIIDRSEQTYIVTLGLAGFVSYYQACVFLRGGYKYDLRSSNPNQKYIVYETETLFYQDVNRPEYDSTIGPITPSEALLLGGAIKKENLYNFNHNHNLTGVGETL